jgi:serine protease Do
MENETPPTLSKNSLMSDVKDSNIKRQNMGLLVTIIILSIIFGSLGGIAGTLYAFKSPGLQKYLTSGNSASATLKQSISLTEDSAIIDVVKKASPSVVSVVISKDLNKIPGFGTSPFDQDPFFNFFGRSNPSTPNSSTPNVQPIGAGSGFFVSNDGTIITNKHVVDDPQASYSVITNDGKKYDAKVLTRDPVSDLAILKIDVKNSSHLDLADSGAIQIGQRVIAIGNSLGQYQNTVTSGIVSGIGRKITAGGAQGEEQLEGVIQTDAAINPGNSGGPLLNISGQVIGINTAIDREGQLVGFAIPSSDASKAVASFQKNGRIIRPFLGVRYIIITPAMAEQQNLPRNYGALVIRGSTATDFAVLPGSPADKAGISENDIILKVDGTRLDEENNLSKLLKNSSVGDTVTLRIYHKGDEKDVKVTLGEAK